MRVSLSAVPLPGLPVILGLALALRVLWALLLPVDPVSDAAAYHVFATNIAVHGVYGFTPDSPGAYWAVGPAAIYAAGYLLFGVGAPLAVILPNLISSLVAVVALHDLGRRWFGPAEGRIAALLFACWPMGIQFTTVLASELHFIALSLVGLAAWDRRGLSVTGMAWVAGAGAAFALATYVRPIALLLPAALALAAILRAPRRELPAILQAVLATLIIFALVSPWSARNERVLGERAFVSTNFWPNFWMGNHAGTDGEYMPLPPDAPRDEIARAAHMRDLALQDLRADPGGFVWRTLWKAVRLHERETIGVGWNEAGIVALGGTAAVTGLKLLSTAYWYGLLAAGLAGVVVLARRHSAWQALVSVPVWLWLYYTAIHAIIVIGDRYHMPAVPMIVLLAAAALAAAPGWRLRAARAG